MAPPRPDEAVARGRRSLDRFAFNSRRSAVYALGGMVASSQPLATQAGLQVLREGGNAADAAVATAAALNVVEPTMTGLGGDCFALYYDARTKHVSGLNGSGRAPAAATIERLAELGVEGEIPRFGVHAVTVPGAAAGWADTVERFGRMALADVLAPAIHLAEDGHPVSPIVAWSWALQEEKLRNASPNAGEMLIDGHAPRVGEIRKNEHLAGVMRTLAEGGPQAFYRGAPGQAIVEVVQQLGGLMEIDDLATHCSTFDEPICATYRDVNVYECPPSGQGIAALLALNIVEGFDLASMPPHSTERAHLLIEAMRLAFADSRWFVADPAQVEVPVEGLLSKAYASERRALIDPAAAAVDRVHGSPVDGSDTVYLSMVDGDSNACSFINSNYNGFGTGIVPRGTGITLQNRGYGFNLDPGHPNALAPGKRPYHTIIPAMATDASGELYACFGVMGGFQQPQGHLQVLVNMLDHGMDPQQALDHPRFSIYSGVAGGQVHLEEGFPIEVMAELAHMGHDVIPAVGAQRLVPFGKGQIIRRNPQTGVLEAGSDPRGDGAAAGY